MRRGKRSRQPLILGSSAAKAAAASGKAADAFKTPVAQPPYRLTTTGSSIQHAHSVIQHSDGAFTLKSGRHGERKLCDLLRLRAAPACRRHVQDRIAAVDVPAARMIIASLTLVLEPRPTAGAGGQASHVLTAHSSAA